MAHFDKYGWYTEEVIEDRVTSVEPLNKSITEIDGELRSNWTGNEWLELPYKAFSILTHKVVPQEVLMYQAREALIRSGITIESIDLIIDSLPSPQKEIAFTQWEYAPTIKRYNSWVSELAPLIPLTEAQLDDLFILAGTL